MKLVLAFLLIVISCTLYGQNYNVAMQVSENDLELNSYPKDSTAKSLVIYDYGNSFVDKSSFLLRVKIKQKIKILTTEGLNRGEIEVRLYKGKKSEETIKNIIGTTYNLEDGKIIKTQMMKDAIYKEENKDYIFVKFVLPNVKVGSVITYSYETQSPYMTKFQPWYFQGIDPVLYSEYNTSIPANYNYHIKLVGELPLDVNENKIERKCLEAGYGGSSDCSVSTYIMKNVPAYKPEQYTTTSLNYTSRIEYELNEIIQFDGSAKQISKSWADVNKELKSDDNFGKQINRKKLVKEVLPANIASLDNNLIKAKAIYQYVLNNYMWNGKSERHNVSLKTLLEEKVGSVFEINLLLQNLYFSEGFEVNPILISTRDNGLATKIYPNLTDFNYVILKLVIGETSYYLNATNSYLPFGEIPYKCLNQYGRLFDSNFNSYWEDLSAKNYSIKMHRVKLKFLDGVNLSGSIESQYSSYSALNSKRRFNENNEEYKRKKANEYNSITINNHEILNFDKTENNFSEKINFELKPEMIGNKVYLNPFLIKFFDENPFKLQERTYPIDFGHKNSYVYALQLELNENLKVLDIPDSVTLSLPNNTGSFVHSTNYQNNQLTMYFKINLSASIYGSNYYEYLKSFMNKVVETQNNTVIIIEKQ